MKKRLLYCLISIIIGCTDSPKVYNNIAIMNDQLVTVNDSIAISNKKIFNGLYKLKVNGSLYKQGVYDKAVSVGKWKYMISSENEFEIDWKKQDEQWEDVSLSVPKKWEVNNKINLPIVAFYNLNPDTNREFIKDDYFSIMIHSDLGDKSLNSYNAYYQEKIRNEGSIYSDYFLISINQKNLLFNRFIIKRKGVSMLLLNINTRIGNSIVDITMNRKDFNMKSCQVEFFEVLRTLRIKNEWILPYTGFLEIISIEEPFEAI